MGKYYSLLKLSSCTYSAFCIALVNILTNTHSDLGIVKDWEKRGFYWKIPAVGVDWKVLSERTRVLIIVNFTTEFLSITKQLVSICFKGVLPCKALFKMSLSHSAQSFYSSFSFAIQHNDNEMKMMSVVKTWYLMESCSE